MKLVWKVWSPRGDVPPQPQFGTLEDVRKFLRSHVSFKDDKGWKVYEEKDGTEIANCTAAFLLSDQGRHCKTILEATTR
jgi:hypothetical protein